MLDATKAKDIVVLPGSGPISYKPAPEASVDKAEYTRLLRDNSGQDPAKLISENKAGLRISIGRLKYTTYGRCPTKVPPGLPRKDDERYPVPACV